jgi:hypothetical protein
MKPAKNPSLTDRETIIQRVRRDRDRLREGIRRIRDQNYDSGYSAETYAAAILSGHEPSEDDELAAVERIYAGDNK